MNANWELKQRITQALSYSIIPKCKYEFESFENKLRTTERELENELFRFCDCPYMSIVYDRGEGVNWDGKCSDLHHRCRNRRNNVTCPSNCSLKEKPCENVFTTDLGNVPCHIGKFNGRAGLAAERVIEKDEPFLLLTGVVRERKMHQKGKENNRYPIPQTNFYLDARESGSLAYFARTIGRGNARVVRQLFNGRTWMVLKANEKIGEGDEITIDDKGIDFDHHICAPVSPPKETCTAPGTPKNKAKMPEIVDLTETPSPPSACPRITNRTSSPQTAPVTRQLFAELRPSVPHHPNNPPETLLRMDMPVPTPGTNTTVTITATNPMTITTTATATTATTPICSNSRSTNTPKPSSSSNESPQNNYPCSEGQDRPDGVLLQLTKKKKPATAPTQQQGQPIPTTTSRKERDGNACAGQGRQGSRGQGSYASPGNNRQKQQDSGSTSENSDEVGPVMVDSPEGIAKRPKKKATKPTHRSTATQSQASETSGPESSSRSRPPSRKTKKPKTSKRQRSSKTGSEEAVQPLDAETSEDTKSNRSKKHKKGSGSDGTTGNLPEPQSSGTPQEPSASTSSSGKKTKTTENPTTVPSAAQPIRRSSRNKPKPTEEQIHPPSPIPSEPHNTAPKKRPPKKGK